MMEGNRRIVYQPLEGDPVDMEGIYNKIRVERQREKSPSLPEELAHIDFDTLHDILKKLLRRGRVGETPLNFIGPTDIFLEDTGPNSSVLADYAVDTVRIYKNNIEESSKKLGVDPAFIYLHTLVHEMIHAAAFGEATFHEGDKDSVRAKVMVFLKPIVSQKIGSRSHVKSGYSVVKDTEKLLGFKVVQQEILSLFNEGVTEMLAQRIVLDYLQRTGYGDVEKRNNYKKAQVNIASAYTEAVVFINAFINQLAERCGVPVDVARGGIINGYLNGEDIMSGETGRLFSDIFSSELLEKISQVQSDFDLERLKKDYL